MQVIRETLQPTIANIAFDEALLEAAELGRVQTEVLRIWQPNEPLVVLGRSSPWRQEVNHAFCQPRGIEFVRRCSGGQSIVAGPGCLMYGILLDYRRRPELRMLDAAHRFVMSQMQAALYGLGIETKIDGTSDLTVDGRKVSGNSMRCKKNWFLYHGTMICSLDIRLISDCLGQPARQPDYRRHRDHIDFLSPLAVGPDLLSDAIVSTWSDQEKLFVADPQLFAATQQLVQSKYATDAWNQKV